MRSWELKGFREDWVGPIVSAWDSGLRVVGLRAL